MFASEAWTKNQSFIQGLNKFYPPSLVKNKSNPQNCPDPPPSINDHSLKE